ncbi:MAG: hypothetical protein OEO21_07370 [Candidatus Krumholzibacteria bacterium]|nr:hypothetical protein [Candidatus Krumholzibacteria bacterium]
MVSAPVILVVALAGVGLGALLGLLRRKNVDLIVRARLARRPERSDGTCHLFVSVADHFEPYWQRADGTRALERVQAWHQEYPRRMEGIRDNGGRAPRHAFFYPEEEYDERCMDLLADLERRGLGVVEVHLHHDNDTSTALHERLSAFKKVLHERHGLLRADPDTGEVRYAFIHGNWTLDNSGPRGENCGVNDELRVLSRSGCYADFTYPSAPHPTQPPMINRIYYATDDPERPRSHWRGEDARYGRAGRGDLLLFTGPLALNWRRRRRGVLPAVENGDITGRNPALPDRVDLWVRHAPAVRGFPRWRFLKPYTHGTQEGNSALLLSDGPGGLAAVYRDLLARYNDGRRYVVHFTTPWEMYRCVRVLEDADDEAIEAVEAFAFRF